MGTENNNIQLSEKADRVSAESACPKLTPKQKKFCQYIASGLNATQAALKAGYSKRSAKQIANENLTKPYLQKVVEENAEKNQQKFEYTREQHFKELTELEELARKQRNIPAAIKAAELKGKLCGLYIERQEIKAQVVSGFAVDQFLEKFNAKH